MMAQFTVVDFVMRLLKIILFAPVGLSGFLFLAGLCLQSLKAYQCFHRGLLFFRG